MSDRTRDVAGPQTPPEGDAGRSGGARRADGDPDAGDDRGSGGGARLLAAAVTLPWVFLYGVTGVWALGLAARSAGRGLRQIDAGYTRLVTPAQLSLVGALLLAAFAVMLACGLLLLFGRRGPVAWLPLLLAAAALTGGAAWAGVSGGIHPLVWVLLFFGLTYVTVVALVLVLRVTSADRRDRIVEP